MNEVKNNQDQQDFLYTNPEDYIKRQGRRARAILRWLIAGLLITVVVYLAVHLTSPGETLLPLEWRSVESGSDLWERVLDWTLWSLTGTLIYLLYEVGHHYPTIRKNVKNDGFPSSFIEYTPWYWVTLVKGPIIALVILFFFNAADLKLTGPDGDGEAALAFEFSKLGHTVTLLLSFVLGFYSRVARKVLDGIMRKLFSRAWAEAHEDYQIDPEKEKVVLGETIVCKTTPTVDVIWATSLGTIDSSGKYTAPKGLEHCGAKVVITAVSKGTPSVARSTTVMLVPFEIVGPGEVILGSENVYSVSTSESGVEWSLSPASGAGIIDKAKGLYKAPLSKEEAKTEEVTIIATIKKTDQVGKKWICSDRFEVTLKKQE